MQDKIIDFLASKQQEAKTRAINVHVSDICKGIGIPKNQVIPKLERMIDSNQIPGTLDTTYYDAVLKIY
ncbi:hypothetical protein [Lactococcus formosensis]|uniref:hypothetical protein n=1 Tax=Lactococcus formosensis TaxID=1281486 RepID=UPI00254BD3BF|nr:hypothetical protein [Lactococcus formosensis]